MKEPVRNDLDVTSWSLAQQDLHNDLTKNGYEAIYTQGIKAFIQDRGNREYLISGDIVLNDGTTLNRNDPDRRRYYPLIGEELSKRNGRQKITLYEGATCEITVDASVTPPLIEITKGPKGYLESQFARNRRNSYSDKRVVYQGARKVSV